MSSLTPNERRWTAAQDSYVAVVKALLWDQAPDELDLGLLCLTVAEAIIAGDRDLLVTLNHACERAPLLSPAEGPDALRLEGSLWVLEAIAGLAATLLELEYRFGDDDPADPRGQS